MKSIVVLLTLFCLCQGTGCPKSWIRANDRCYYISDNYDTFDGSNKYCKDRKSQLAPALTCDAHINLVEVLADHRAKCPRGQKCDEFWIGIQNISGSEWRTGNDLPIDGKRRCEQWAKGYPRGLGTCGKMSLKGTRKRGVWKNANCTDRLKYVCIMSPDNFDYVPEINECFYLNLKPATWNEAQRTCSKMKKGARLLTIHDATKQKAVVDYVNVQVKIKDTNVCHFSALGHGGMKLWLGGQTENPNDCNSPFVWKSLGAPDIPFTYVNWFPGFPDCGRHDGHCAIITSMFDSFRWDDSGCQLSFCYICEF